MSKYPKPFFRSARQCWYVQLGSRQVRLHPDEAEARKRYHELMAEQARRPAALPATAELTVAEVFDKFLGWCQAHREPRTFTDYQRHLQRFCTARREIACMPASALRPFHLFEFVDEYPTWGNAARRQALQTLQRPFSWAEKLGYIERSPIRSIEKPKATRREQSVSAEEWPRIRDSYREGDPFRDVLEFLWETGCRPQEIKRLEVRHLDLANHRAIIPKAEAKGKRRPRVIVLTPRAEAIIKRRVGRRTQGIVFLHSQGRPWSAYSMNCRFTRLRHKLGIKYAAYSFRHGFADRMLMNAVDCMTVAWRRVFAITAPAARLVIAA